MQTEGQVQGAEVERKSELLTLVGGCGDRIRKNSTTRCRELKNELIYFLPLSKLFWLG